uniref:Guanine nucleotide-binding protein subunit beta-like protein n=1 Tax=Rhizochromulina marina TaxID=1034831 RepID=A0A7S2RZP4_9STRA|mmetsp:Transcript_23168/g.67563  ORF Transcript_23168/g.67563 Transcript_23168/m.67563 type:complete len:570 (+) Transcript_23168:79-1788(+)
MRKRYSCPHRGCRHVHAQGQPCHVFVPTRKLKEPEPDSDLDSDEMSSDEDDVDALQNMSAEEVEEMHRAEAQAAAEAGADAEITMADIMKMGKKGLSMLAKGGQQLKEAAKHGAHKAKMTGKRLRGKASNGMPTPDWVKKCGYRRCNCDYGVPDNDPEFLAVPGERYVGGICINTGVCAPVPPPARVLAPPEECLRGAFPFLNPKSLGRAKAVTGLWAKEVALQPHYHDMRYFEPVCEIQAHNRRIESCFGFRGFAYTSGDNCIKVWDMRERQGTLAHTCCKDTAPITVAMEIDAFLFLASANGALRKWSMPFKVTNIDFRGSMWLHNKVVNDMAHWKKGQESVLFTVCDDRICRVWDLTVNRCIHVIDPIDRESGTLRSACCSDQFFFIGSSNGRIDVYLTERKCRRQDRHICHLPSGPVPYCHQTTLSHGDPEVRPVVTALEVGGFHHREDYLFTGGSDGRIQIFSLPDYGLEFPLVHILDLHTAPVTSLRCSWAHLITGGDDGRLNVLSLYCNDWKIALERRHILPKERVKCLFIADEDDIEQDVAHLYLGTNRGRLLMYRLGSYV